MLRSKIKRNKDKTSVVIEIDGRAPLAGYLFTVRGERVIDLLNDEREFLPLELYSGDAVIVRKSKIQMIEQESEHKKVSPLFCGSADEIFGTDEIIDQVELKSAFENQLDLLHPDRITQAGLHPALEDCARMLTGRLVSSYEKASEDLLRKNMRQAQLDAEAERGNNRIALKSA